MIEELRKILDEELSIIVENAKYNRPSQIRFGQAVFNACYNKFPNSVGCLTGTNYDCFYNDDKVNDFICRLKTVLLNKLTD